VTDPRTVAVVLLVAMAPLAVVLVVALLRGYTITLHLTRITKRRRDDE